MKSVRIFVSSPGDTHFERMRVERVIERLNGEFSAAAKLEAVRWETKYYQARATFQQQIPEAADCEMVIAILRHRLGTELPDDFPAMPNGDRYPSGTAYEILSAIEASKQKSVPDVYVFRYSEPPTVKLDDESTNKLVSEQWNRLKTFFKTWFQTQDGKFKLAFHSFHSTDEFELEVEKLLRGWLEEKVLKGRSVLWPIETKGSPFRGLAAFGAKHAPVFFGRSRDTAKAIDALKDAGARGTPFMLLVGASGSGKSSLALAGIVPRLTAPGVVPSVDLWRVDIMRPSEESGPVAALAVRLFDTAEDNADECPLPALPEMASSDYATPAELTKLLSHADESCAKPIVKALDRIAETEAQRVGHDRPVRADLLIVVDQLDELFASEVSDAERTRFAALLSQLVATGRVWVIATLRADLYERFLKEPDLLAMKTKGATYDLAPPGTTEIDEIIRGPAIAAGLVYENDAKTGEDLDDRLIRDVDRPDMLPLLQFALDYLFDQRVSADGKTLLTLKAYDTLGGLSGAIDKEAERAIAPLGKDERERLPRLLRQLAAPAPSGEPGASASLSIRSVPLVEAAYDPPSQRLVKALVDARILLSSGSEQNASIRLAHQRVLENWKRAKEIVAANAEFFRIRDDVEALRRRWEKSSKKRDLLIPKGVPLAEAESIAKRYPEELGVPTLGFIGASRNRARLKQRLGALLLVTVFLVGGVTAYANAKRLTRQLDTAKERIAELAGEVREHQLQAAQDLAQPQFSRTDVNRLLNAVYLIVKKEGDSPAATAWALGPHKLATAAHVTEAIRTAPVGTYFLLGPSGDRIDIKAVQSHPGYSAFKAYKQTQGNLERGEFEPLNVINEYDVGIIEVDSAKTLPVALEIAPQEDLVSLAAGLPVAWAGFLSEGLVRPGTGVTPVTILQFGQITSLLDVFMSRVDDWEHRLLILHNVPMAGGAAGSPLINPEGKVIAIVSGGNVVVVTDANGDKTRIPHPALVNFAQRVDSLEDLLDGRALDGLTKEKTYWEVAGKRFQRYFDRALALFLSDTKQRYGVDVSDNSNLGTGVLDPGETTASRFLSSSYMVDAKPGFVYGFIADASGGVPIGIYVKNGSESLRDATEPRKTSERELAPTAWATVSEPTTLEVIVWTFANQPGEYSLQMYRWAAKTSLTSPANPIGNAKTAP
jgi:hypothetical protein